MVLDLHLRRLYKCFQRDRRESPLRFLDDATHVAVARVVSPPLATKLIADSST
jgi:hypothetical protein